MIKYTLLLSTALLLSACTSGPIFEPWEEEGEVTDVVFAPTGSVYKMEKPYEINGVWYYPAENYTYVEEGYASWYMPANGTTAKTANDEEYIATEMSARHKTLPLPSLVKITNLQNGKTIIARVNDRGPMVNNRLIDVSQKAAQELEFPVTGTTKVRVEILAKESQQMRDELLAAGQVYMETAPQEEVVHEVVQPEPEPIVQEVVQPVQPVQPVQTPKVITVAPTGTYIQLGAFGNPANAAKAEQAASSFTKVITTTKAQGNRTLSVVKAGPYANPAEAEQALKQLKQLGYRDAYIVK